MTTTTKAAHTPGPWHVYENCPAFDNSDVIFSAHVDDAIVCSIGGDLVGEKANARLIAAAPDLLDSLENLLDYLDAHDWGTVPSGGKTETDARAAIQKAKGGQ